MWHVYLSLSQKELMPTKLDSPLYPGGKVFIQKAVIIKIIILFALSEAMYLVLIVHKKCFVSLNVYQKDKSSLIKDNLLELVIICSLNSIFFVSWFFFLPFQPSLNYDKTIKIILLVCQISFTRIFCCGFT